MVLGCAQTVKTDVGKSENIEDKIVKTKVAKSETVEIKVVQTEEEKIIQLIKQLGDDDWQKREAATQELIKIGRPTTKYLKQVIEHQDAEVRLRVKMVLSEIGDLVAHWKFNKTSDTTLYDSSGNEHEGKIHGAKWVTGTVGSALSFDGKDDYVIVPYSSSDSSASWTIAIRVYPYKISGASGWGWTIYTADNPVKAFYKTLGQYNDKFRFIYSLGAKNYVVDSQQSILANTWYDVALSYDDTSRIFRLYINGVLDQQNISAQTPATTTKSVIIGARAIGYNESQYFKGLIDEVKIYSYARSAAEIQTDYKNTCHKSNPLKAK